MRKLNSSNSLNKQVIHSKCSLAYTISLIGGRWKPTILWQLLNGQLRYNELKRSIAEVSERVLVTQLRELEADGLITRMVYPEVPPNVAYELTELGLSLRTLLMEIARWGDEHKPAPNAAP